MSFPQTNNNPFAVYQQGNAPTGTIRPDAYINFNFTDTSGTQNFSLGVPLFSKPGSTVKREQVQNLLLAKNDQFEKEIEQYEEDMETYAEAKAEYNSLTDAKKKKAKSPKKPVLPEFKLNNLTVSINKLEAMGEEITL